MVALKVILAGAGKMGGAMREGWRQGGMDVLAVDPASADGRATFSSVDALPQDFRPDAVVLAVKPQVMAQVAPAYARYADALFLSIAAGTSLAHLAEYLGEDAAIVRAMPNLPATIRQGVSVGVANAMVSQEQQSVAGRLLDAIGSVHWLQDEGLMDAVTAVSGSGPAYLFHFVEALEAAAVHVGLPEALARSLARDTVAGSAALLRQSEESPALLRESVTSKGGTTAAALGALMGNQKLQKLLEEAVEAARKRSVELRG